MEKKVAELIEENKLKSKSFVLAVSGGVDSIVLLDIFTKIFPKEKLVIAHVNHGLRKQSEKEAIFVKSLADKYDLPIFVKNLNLKTKSEVVARNKRYSFLDTVLLETHSDYIVTAHHLNDQAETILLKLTRGSGPMDVWGIRPLENNLFRPLLDFSKEELVSYAKKHKLSWVEDPSNKDKSFARNRIRASVIPELEKINPKFLENVKKTAQLGQESADLLKKQVSNAEKRVIRDNLINLKALKAVKSDFIKKEIIKKMLWELTGQKEGIYSKNIQEVQKLIDTKGTKITRLKGYTITKTYDKITFGSKQKRQQKRANFNGESILFNGFLIKRSKKVKISGKNNILLPSDIAYNLSIRIWAPGDKIKTKGGTKKIQDVFTDAKIPQDERLRWPIMTSGKEIIWVPMLAKGDLNPGSSKIMLEVVDERKKL